MHERDRPQGYGGGLHDRRRGLQIDNAGGFDADGRWFGSRHEVRKRYDTEDSLRSAGEEGEPTDDAVCERHPMRCEAVCLDGLAAPGGTDEHQDHERERGRGGA